MVRLNIFLIILMAFFGSTNYAKEDTMLKGLKNKESDVLAELKKAQEALNNEDIEEAQRLLESIRKAIRRYYELRSKH